MMIYDYIIPQELQTNSFIVSLNRQFKECGKLTPRQYEALQDMLDIDLDFYTDIKYEINENYINDYTQLINKLKKTNFRKAKTKNNCIRAIQSIIEGKPRFSLIMGILVGYNYRRRRY